MATALKLLQRTPDTPADLLQGNPEFLKANNAEGYNIGDTAAVGTSGGASGDAFSHVVGTAPDVVADTGYGTRSYHHPAQAAGVQSFVQLQAITQSRAIVLHRWVKRNGAPSSTIEWLRGSSNAGFGGGVGINLTAAGVLSTGQGPVVNVGSAPAGTWWREELVLYNLAGNVSAGSYLAYSCYDAAGDLLFPTLEQWNSVGNATAYRFATFGKSNSSPSGPEFWQADLRVALNRTTFLGDSVQLVTVALQPAAVALQAQPLAPTPGPVTVDLQPATVTLTAQPLSPAAVAVQLALQPAQVTLQAQPLTPAPGPVAATLTPATVTLQARPLSPTPGPVSVALQPAVAALQARSLSPAPTPVTISLQPATVTLAAQPVSPSPGPVSLDLTPALLAVQAQPLAPVPGAVSVELGPALVQLQARPLPATPGPVTVTLTPAVVTLEAQPIAGTPVAAVNLQPALVTLQARPLSPQPRPVTLALAPALLQLQALPLDAVPGPVSVELSPATVTLLARSLAPEPGPVSVELVPAVLLLIAQPFTVTVIPDTDGKPVRRPRAVTVVPESVATATPPISAASATPPSSRAAATAPTSRASATAPISKAVTTMEGYTQGDTGPDLFVDLQSTPAASFAGATAVLHLRKPDGQTLSKSGAAAGLDPESGRVTVHWAVGDLSQAGLYEGEVQVTYSSNQVQTFPGVLFNVRAELA